MQKDIGNRKKKSQVPFPGAKYPTSRFVNPQHQVTPRNHSDGRPFGLIWVLEGLGVLCVKRLG